MFKTLLESFNFVHEYCSEASGGKSLEFRV